jgi:hypothetical protein
MTTELTDLAEVAAMTNLLTKSGFTITRVDPTGTRGHWRVTRDKQTFVLGEWHSVKALIARLGAPT